MKRTVCLLLTFIICAVSVVFTASAESYTLRDNIKISVPDGYTLLTDDNLKKHEDTVALLNYTVSALRNYIEENGVIFVAVDENNENQLQLKCIETTFSGDIKDLDGLSNSDLQTIGKNIINGSFETVSINGTTYFKTASDGHVGFATVQYFTIKNSKLYSLSYFGSDYKIALSVASTLDIPKVESSSAKTVFLIIILWVALIAVFAVAVFLVITLVSDIRKSREDNDVREFIKIKRSRRF